MLVLLKFCRLGVFCCLPSVGNTANINAQLSARVASLEFVGSKVGRMALAASEPAWSFYEDHQKLGKKQGNKTYHAAGLPCRELEPTCSTQMYNIYIYIHVNENMKIFIYICLSSLSQLPLNVAKMTKGHSFIDAFFLSQEYPSNLRDHLVNKLWHLLNIVH